MLDRVVLEQAKLIDKAFHNLETEMDNLLGLKKGHIRIRITADHRRLFLPANS